MSNDAPDSQMPGATFRVEESPGLLARVGALVLPGIAPNTSIRERPDSRVPPTGEEPRRNTGVTGHGHALRRPVDRRSRRRRRADVAHARGGCPDGEGPGWTRSR